MEPNEIALSLRGAATKWEARHPIIGVGQLRVHDALNDAADCIEKLQAELEVSQRQLMAAAEDLKMVCISGETCVACKYCCSMGDGFPCRIGEWCLGEKWQWRGPREAGEGQSG